MILDSNEQITSSFQIENELMESVAAEVIGLAVVCVEPRFSRRGTC